MISDTIQNYTLIKIYMSHYGCRCQYVDGDRVIKARLTEKLIDKINARVLTLRLKPIYAITVDEVMVIYKLLEKIRIQNGEDVPIEEEPTDEQKKELREHFIDTAPYEINYPIADYLRRAGYHLPMYGLDLFKSGIAVAYVDEPQKQTI